MTPLYVTVNKLAAVTFDMSLVSILVSMSMRKDRLQWNLDLTMCQGTREIGWFYRGFVLAKTLL